MKKSGKKRNWLKITIIAVIILVILAALYIGARAYMNMRANRNEMIFQQGLQIGYSEAILQIMNLSLSCQPVPVYAGNASMELIAVDCLR